MKTMFEINSISNIPLMHRKLVGWPKADGTLAQFLIIPYLCERTAMAWLPTQLRHSSGFSPDSPHIVFGFCFPYMKLSPKFL